MIINPYAFGVSYDPDAQAFFTASGLTGATNLTAVNQLVLDLKAANIWTKMKAIYPIIGGTAALHKWNLKDPQDTNAAFRLTFNGGWTHSATGALPNGTNGYADTFLNANTTLQQFSHHHSFYHNSNGTLLANTSFGGAQATTSSVFRTGTVPAGTINIQCRSLVAVNDDVAYTVITVKGFRASSRISNNNMFQINQNGTTTTPSTTLVTAALPNSSSYLSADLSAGNAQRYSVMQVAFHSIGDGLSAAEGLSLRNAVQAYQTTLSRQV